MLDRGISQSYLIAMPTEPTRSNFDFYYGLGSRYSYLAVTQLEALAAAGVALNWCPIYSPDLISRVGPDPFSSSSQRGQYAWNYRAEDAARWARHYGVPYNDPGQAKVDWRQIAMWAVAAKLLGRAREFSIWALERTFVEGEPPGTVGALTRGAIAVGLDPASIGAIVASGEVENHHDALIERAHAQGAFGVPAFVAEDGALFWGQDRLPLLHDYLNHRRASGCLDEEA